MTAPARAAAGPTTGFLEESPGNRSAMRLMCLLALLASIAFGAITMLRSAPMLSRDAAGQESLTYPPRDDTGLTLTFAFLLAAFAPKLVQKFAEQRLGGLKGSSLRELLLGSGIGPPAEDPRTPIQVSPATPVTTPALSPLERIRLGGSL